MAAGIVLFLVALDPVLAQYKPKKTEFETLKPGNSPELSPSALAFSPLAFPTIVTPYGIAVLILLGTLRPHNLLEVAGVTAFVLVLNLLAWADE